MREIHQLWAHITLARRKHLAWLLLIIVFASMAEMVSIGSVLPFLGTLMSPEKVYNAKIIQPLIALLKIKSPQDLLFPLTVFFIFAAIFSGAMRLLLLWAQTRLAHAIGADLSISIFKKTLYQPYSTHIVRNTSEVIDGIANKTNTTVNFILLPLLAAVSATLILSTILVTFIIFDPVTALGSFVIFGSVYGIVIFLIKKRLAKDGEIVSKESNRVIQALQEGLGGIRDILIDGSQQIFCKVYHDADLPLRRSLANMQIAGGAPRFLIEAFGMILIATIAYTFIESGEGVMGAIPVLGTLAIGAQRMLPLFQQVYFGWSSVHSAKSSLLDVLAFLSQEIPKTAVNPAMAKLPFNSLITLNDVSFSYFQNSPLVLQNINLKIAKKSKIGFIGTTGSGKSTLLDIIMGLLPPSEGFLSIDGVAITDNNRRKWQAHLAHVPQSIFLVDSTIAENIAFGVPPEEIDLNRVRHAARIAQIADFIENLPDKYDSMVGERGIRISGGQRQRIGLARAFYKNADILILDEATSALDNETEQAVMNAIEFHKMDVTVLMVAHRLTTLKNCDLIVELSRGAIARIGTYSEMVLLSNHEKLI
jgi:ATP-binding cassette subfamily B protein